MITPCSEEENFYKLDNMVLSSGQYLRQIFKERWKAKTDEEWQDESEFIKKFITGHGEQAYQMVPFFEQKALEESKSIEDWDISLLTNVLQNFWTFGSGKKYKRENGALKELKNLRNDLAHKMPRKYAQEKYNVRVDTFRGSLKALGMKEEDVEKLIDMAGLTSSEQALERVKLFYQEACVLIEEDKFDEAITLYSDALSTPSLLPVHLGEAYEKRANCYLKSKEKNKAVDEEHCNLALIDVKEALELNPNSWRAHHINGQCHQSKNDLSQAIQCYEQALQLHPRQKDVKNDLYSCKLFAGLRSCRDHLNPRLLPMSMNDRLEKWKNETGLSISEQDFIRVQQEKASKLCKGQDHVFLGHQYSLGMGVTQDYTKAFQHFVQADKAGNLEGSYNLAECYHHGRGGYQNFKKALQIYRRVAKENVNTEGKTTPLNCNVGVAASQHAIGVMHQFGVGVKENYVEAAVWYERAMNNGVGESANNLGILYWCGQGVPLDEKKAEMCWKKGLDWHAVNSAASLVSYYLDQLEPDKAWDMLERGRKMGHDSLLSITDETFERMLEQIRAERSSLEPDILNFENYNKLEMKGLTFKQRRLRRSKNLAEQMRGAVLKLLVRPDPDGCGDKVTPDLIKTTEILNSMISQFNPMYNEIDQTTNDSGNTDMWSLKEENMAEVHSKQNIDSAPVLVTPCLDQLEPDEALDVIRITREKRHASLISNTGEKSQRLLEDVRATRSVLEPCVLKFERGNKLETNELTFKQRLVRYVSLAEPMCGVFPSLPATPYPDGCGDKVTRDLKNSTEIVSNPISQFNLMDNMIEQAVNNLARMYTERPLEESLAEFLRDLRTASKDIDYAAALVAYFLDQLEPEKASCMLRIAKEIGCYVSSIPNSNKKKKKYIEEMKPLEILDQKQYLKSSQRRKIFRKHRKSLNEKSPGNHLKDCCRMVPKLKHYAPRKIAGMHSITLDQMIATEDKIFENRFLELTIADDPNPDHCFAAIHLIAEDENGDTSRLDIYNMKTDKETLEKFQAGCRIALYNPYRRRVGECYVIRNDEPKCILYLDGLTEMCRFCGKENASLRCSKCKRPYCTEECQISDRKFGHKLICVSKL